MIRDQSLATISGHHLLFLDRKGGPSCHQELTTSAIDKLKGWWNAFYPAKLAAIV